MTGPPDGKPRPNDIPLSRSASVVRNRTRRNHYIAHGAHTPFPWVAAASPHATKKSVWEYDVTGFPELPGQFDRCLT